MPCGERANANLPPDDMKVLDMEKCPDLL